MERKYRFDKNFTETKKAGAQAQKAAEEAQTAANDATHQLADKVGRTENEQVVNMVNAAGKPISAEFDQSEGEHRVHFKGGVINLTSPQVERSTGVAWESKVLLMTFRADEHKKYGLYAYGNSIPIDPNASADDPTIGADGRYWTPSSAQSLYIEEITE